MGSSANQPTQQGQVAMNQAAAMGAGQMGGLAGQGKPSSVNIYQPKTSPNPYQQAAVMGAGQMGQQQAGMRSAQVMPMQLQQPQQQPNVFQQSAGSLGQAQRTLTGLSQFQPQQMRAAGTAPTATYGGATVERTAGPQFAQIGGMQTYAGATIDPIERARAAQLGLAQTMQSVGAVQAAQAPEQIAVDQLRTQDISAYMNPYQQQVIEAGQADIERQRQMASENLAAQAQRAGAFGGSRQAVQEGVLAGEALRQAGQLSAQQRQAGFQQAIESGKFDIGQTQAARTMASQQEFQASQLGQQAREAAAAREQAARAGNMEAANQFAQQQAQLEQQATLANQAAFNTRAQAQAGLTQQAGLSSMQAVNERTMQQAAFEQQAAMAAAAQEAARASQQAGLTQSAGQTNQAAINAAIQAQAARQQAANQANYQGQFTGAGIQQGAAGGLAALGGQQFGIGQQIQGAIGQQGALQRTIQQQILDNARQQYAGATGAPLAGLGMYSQILGATPYTQTQTTSQGFNPASLLMML